MHYRLKNYLDSLLDVFFPPSCIVCGTPNSKYLCEKCYKSLLKSKYPNSHFVTHFGDKVYCSTKYSREAASIVKSLKYGRNFPAAGWVAKIMLPVIESIPTIYANQEETIIVPVPVSFQKNLSRGFNQCEIIGEKISRITGIKMNKSILKRKLFFKDKDQIGLVRTQRETNPTCKFETLDIGNVSSILLIDDICTTGKTMYECKLAIKEIYPACNINMMVFSHPQD
ncbi:MAG: ComF family protein [Caldisericia bacterium]|nr:ComF family protein [Caldisericia bacterium]